MRYVYLIHADIDRGAGFGPPHSTNRAHTTQVHNRKAVCYVFIVIVYNRR